MASDTAERFINSQGGVFIGYGNVLSEVGAVVGSTYSVDPSMIHDNIRYPNYDKSARFTRWQIYGPSNYSQMYIDIPVQLSKLTTIEFLCMGGIQTNYPNQQYENMSFQVFTSTADLYDNTMSAAPENEASNGLQDLFIRNTGLDWLDPDFWFGYSKTLLTKRTIMSPFLFDGPRLVKSLMIRIIVDIPEDSVLYGQGTGPTIPPPIDSLVSIDLSVDTKYYLDLAFLYVGQAHFFEVSYGWTTTTSPIGNPATATMGNSMRGNYRGEYKTININIPDLSESQFMYRLVRNIIGTKPTFARFIVFPKPTAVQHFYDRAMLAVLASPADQTHGYYNGFESTLQLRETM